MDRFQPSSDHTDRRSAPSSERRLLHRASSPAEEGALTSLPADWQQQSVRRLFYAVLIALGGATVALALSLLRQEAVGVRVGTERPTWPLWVALGGSLAMVFVVRAPGLRAQRKLDLGLAFLVLFCFVASYFRHALPYDPADVLRGQSPVVFVILFFAITVPVSPWRMAAGGVVAALTDPLTLGITIAQGNPNPVWNLWLWLFAPNVAAVIIAVVSSRLLFQVGRSVKEAREMGAYRLVERLGAGGMGEVWRAEHRTLARPAAVKLVRPEALGTADPESRERILRRFEREAQATAMLTSPHTIEVFDFGVSRDGSFYYVMELLQGMTLEELIQVAGPLPPARAAYLLAQVCHSLRDAHHAGMVHRDIKPANIFVCRHGLEWDYVKVLDFGLVKQVEAEDTRITVAGGLAGTPAYMAPEAIRGGDVGPLADLYALGCVGYRLLTGRDVFAGKTPIELLFAHVEAPPEPLAHLAPGTPAALGELIMRCLAKDPATRPASAEAVREALWQTGLAAQWTPAEARAWWEQEPATAAAADPAMEPTAAALSPSAAEANTLPAEAAVEPTIATGAPPGREEG